MEYGNGNEAINLWIKWRKPGGIVFILIFSFLKSYKIAVKGNNTHRVSSLLPSFRYKYHFNSRLIYHAKKYLHYFNFMGWVSRIELWSFTLIWVELRMWIKFRLQNRLRNQAFLLGISLSLYIRFALKINAHTVCVHKVSRLVSGQKNY